MIAARMCVISSLNIMHITADKSDKGDRFDMMIDYVKILRYEGNGGPTPVCSYKANDIYRVNSAN